jgi:hypothetical protein
VIRNRRRLVALIALAAFLLVAVIVGITGLVNSGPSGPAAIPSPSQTAGPSSPEPDGQSDEHRLPETDDALRYARAVAMALYNWNTGDATPTTVADVLIADGDPSGLELNGLASDIRLHLPTAEQWELLREYETTQTLRVDTAAVPYSWSEIAREQADQLVPGTVAVNIFATRTRAGIWQDGITESNSTVSFTVFVACSPGFDRCRLLRLSTPGQTLE